MISSLIREALKARLIMIVIALALVGFGIRSSLKLSVDAFPDVTVVVLEQNYRSTQTILDAANAVIARNFGREVDVPRAGAAGGIAAGLAGFLGAADRLDLQRYLLAAMRLELRRLDVTGGDDQERLGSVLEIAQARRRRQPAAWFQRSA